MDFSQIISCAIPNGETVKIEVNGAVIWELAETEAYKNWANYAIDTNGSLYNDCGYMEDYRLNSSGVAKQLTGAIHSGFIPVVYGDVILAKGCTAAIGSGGNYFGIYDENFTLLSILTMSVLSGANYCSATYQLQSDGFYMLTVDTSKAGATLLANMKKAKYFRVSFGACEPENFIITVNEEIT